MFINIKLCTYKAELYVTLKPSDGCNYAHHLRLSGYAIDVVELRLSNS